MTCSNQKGVLHAGGTEEKLAVVELGGGSRGRPVWCSTRRWHALALGTRDIADKERELSHYLGKDSLIDFFLIHLEFSYKAQFIAKLKPLLLDSLKYVFFFLISLPPLLNY